VYIVLRGALENVSLNFSPAGFKPTQTRRKPILRQGFVWQAEQKVSFNPFAPDFARWATTGRLSALRSFSAK
jgi:hypothetical protein